MNEYHTPNSPSKDKPISITIDIDDFYGTGIEYVEIIINKEKIKFTTDEIYSVLKHLKTMNSTKGKGHD